MLYTADGRPVLGCAPFCKKYATSVSPSARRQTGSSQGDCAGILEPIDVVHHRTAWSIPPRLIMAALLPRHPGHGMDMDMGDGSASMAGMFVPSPHPSITC